MLNRPHCHPSFKRTAYQVTTQNVSRNIFSLPCDEVDVAVSHSLWSSLLCPPLPCTGIRAWRMTVSQASPWSPATTQYTREAVTTSKECALWPGKWGMESWAGPRTCSTSEREISCRTGGDGAGVPECLTFSKQEKQQWFVGRESNLVVFGAALTLVQSDGFPVQDPVMTFPLSSQMPKIKMLKWDGC